MSLNLRYLNVSSEYVERLIICYSSYFRMYELKPRIGKMFQNVNGDDIFSPKFTAHSLRMLGSLDMAVQLLDDPVTFETYMSHLQQQHRQRKVTADYFDVSLSISLFQMEPFASN